LLLANQSLLFCKLIISCQSHSEGHLVVYLIVQIDKAIVQKETIVTLVSIRVVYLISLFDACISNYNEPLQCVAVVPARLSRHLVVQHVCVGHKPFSFFTFNVEAKHSTTDHHSDLRILLNWELRKLRNFKTNEIIVCVDIDDLAIYLLYKGAPIQPGLLVFSVKDGEVVELLRQNLQIPPVVSVFFPSLLHDKS